MTRRTFLVTDAPDGIGRQTALNLVRLAYTTTMLAGAGRSKAMRP